MAGQPYGGRTVFSVGTGIGQSIEIQYADLPILICTKTDSDLHLVTRGAGDLAFLSGIDQLGGATGL